VAYFGTVLSGLIAEVFGVPGIPIAAAVGVLSFEVPTFCASDPPPLPTITAQDAMDLLGLLGGTLPSPAVTAKWTQLISYYLWFKLCECSSVGTPAPSSSTWPPGVGTNTNVSNPATQACAHSNHPSFPLSANPLNDMVFWSGGVPHNPNATQLQIQCFDVGITQNTTVQLLYYDQNGGQISITTLQVLLVGGPGFTLTIPIPVGTATVQLRFSWAGAMDPAARMTWIADEYCGGGPGGLLEECCAPDTYTQALLTRIANTLDLVQRYGLPFAYVLGASHSGISGAGTFAISRLLGMRVTITSDTSSHPTTPGTPTYIWDLGWMSIENGDGMIDEVRITRTNQMWFSRLFPTSLTFGYYLRDGVTATFQEIEAEP
jgi:hypothetical protein